MTATVAAADRLYLEEKEMSKNNCSPFSEDEGHSPYRSRPLKKRRLQQNRREDETSEKAPSCGHNDDNERDLVNDHDASYNSSAPPLSAAPVSDDEGDYDHDNVQISSFPPPLRARRQHGKKNVVSIDNFPIVRGISYPPTPPLSHERPLHCTTAGVYFGGVEITGGQTDTYFSHPLVSFVAGKPAMDYPRFSRHRNLAGNQTQPWWRPLTSQPFLPNCAGLKVSLHMIHQQHVPTVRPKHDKNLDDKNDHPVAYFSPHKVGILQQRDLVLSSPTCTVTQADGPPAGTFSSLTSLKTRLSPLMTPPLFPSQPPAPPSPGHVPRGRGPGAALPLIPNRLTWWTLQLP